MLFYDNILFFMKVQRNYQCQLIILYTSPTPQRTEPQKTEPQKLVAFREATKNLILSAVVCECLPRETRTCSCFTGVCGKIKNLLCELCASAVKYNISCKILLILSKRVVTIKANCIIAVIIVLCLALPALAAQIIRLSNKHR